MTVYSKEIVKIAKLLCSQNGYDPDKLEPGDLPSIDGKCPNGAPGHYMWREYTVQAREIIRAIKS